MSCDASACVLLGVCGMVDMCSYECAMLSYMPDLGPRFPLCHAVWRWLYSTALKAQQRGPRDSIT